VATKFTALETHDLSATGIFNLWDHPWKDLKMGI
jgi:hypothetical protein